MARDLEKVREYFKGDTYAMMTGVVIDEVDDDYAKCHFEMDKKIHCNAAGGLMGGAIFALADVTFAVATNDPGKYTVNVSSDIMFMTMAKGKIITATATKIKDGRRSCFYQVDVTDELGTKIAVVTVNGAHLS